MTEDTYDRIYKPNIELTIMKARSNSKVTSTIEYKKDEVCKCRSCNRSFHQSEIKREQTEQVHSRVKRMCPYCWSEKFGLIDYPVCEEEQIYKNGKFYANSGIHIKSRIDKLILDEE